LIFPERIIYVKNYKSIKNTNLNIGGIINLVKKGYFKSNIAPLDAIAVLFQVKAALGTFINSFHISRIEFASKNAIV